MNNLKRSGSDSGWDGTYYQVEGDDLYVRAGPAQKKVKGEDSELVEKRPALFKKALPKNIAERVERVQSQRFYCVGRTRTSLITETYTVLGSTGNCYQVDIGPLPDCSCPDGVKGNCCKHRLFVLLKVLNIPSTSNLYYQKGLLASELTSIFANAQRNPLDVATERLQQLYQSTIAAASSSSTTTSAPQDPIDLVEKRFPSYDDCCPVCYEIFGDVKSVASLVFCTAAQGCGNAVHAECFKEWAKKMKPTTCVCCRAPWKVTASSSTYTAAKVNAEGYLNLGSQSGISPIRDTSSYYNGPRKGERWNPYYGSDRYAGKFRYD